MKDGYGVERWKKDGKKEESGGAAGRRSRKRWKKDGNIFSALGARLKKRRNNENTIAHVPA
jgi:hypothetical protein